MESKNIINGVDFSHDEKLEIRNKIEELKKFEVDEEQVDDLIDDTSEDVVICGIKFNPSRILKECDEIAYNEVKNELESNQKDELYDDIEEMIENSDLSDEEKDFLAEEVKTCGA